MILFLVKLAIYLKTYSNNNFNRSLVTYFSQFCLKRQQIVTRINISLLIFLFMDGLSAVEELLFCKQITTRIIVCEYQNFSYAMRCNKGVEICTDEARAMPGKFKSLQAFVKEENCIWIRY